MSGSSAGEEAAESSEEEGTDDPPPDAEPSEGDTQEGGVCGASSYVGLSGAHLNWVRGRWAGVDASEWTNVGPQLVPGVLYHSGDPQRFGSNLALSDVGTVETATGAFRHRQVLLSLASDVSGMGLVLVHTYHSEADSALEDPPLGPNAFFSGYELLVPSHEVHPAATLTLHRGDGLTVEPYERIGQTDDYTTPPGVFDAFSWVTSAPPVGPLDGGGQTGYYVRRLPDGRRMWYARTGSNRFVRIMVVDLYGNAILYGYDDLQNANPRLVEIVDTRGVRIVLTWSEVQQGTWRITRIAVDPSTVPFLSPAIGGASDLWLQLYYQGPGARLSEIRYFPRKVSWDANQDGSIDPDTETVVARPALRLLYDGTHHRLERVDDVTLESESVVTTLLTVGWQWIASRWRVIQQVEGDDPKVHPVHNFDWSVSGSTVQEVTYVDPRGTTAVLTLNGQGQVTQVVMQSETSAQGRPREADGFTGADHAQLAWTLTYDCNSCRLPASITTPEGKKYEYLWDQARGLVLEARLLGSDAKSQREEKFTYDTWASGSSLLTYTDAAGKVTTITYQRYQGGGISEASVALPGWTDADDNPQTSQPIVFEYSSRGNMVRHVTPGGAVVEVLYRGATDNGKYLPYRKVLESGSVDVQIGYAFDDLARLLEMERGLGSGRKTLFERNLNRAVEAVERAPVGQGSSPQPVRTEVYRDSFGAAVVVRRENRDHEGQLRMRPWVVTETLRDRHRRVVVRRLDAAPLDAADPEPLTVEIEYTPDHLPAKVTRPNGSTVTYVTDGYGHLYKTVLEGATHSFTPVRVFLDGDGDVIRWLDGKGNETLLSRDALGDVLSILDAEAGKWELDRDVFGRIVSAKGIDTGNGDQVLSWTEHAFDELGRLKRRKRHLLDSQGQIQKTEETRYFFNAWGLVHRIELPLSRGLEADYDAIGRLQRLRDRLHASDISLQNQVQLVYEAGTGRILQRVVREVEEGDMDTPPGSGTQREYEEDFLYDLWDRVVEHRRRREAGSSTGPAEIVHTFAWDSFSNRSLWKDSQDMAVEQVHDALGRGRRREHVPTDGKGVIDLLVEYHDAGLPGSMKPAVERRDGIGRWTRHVFDEIHRLAEIQNPGYDPGSPQAHRIAFTYDDAGNVEKIEDGTGTELTQLFDDTNRLIARGVTNLGAGVSILGTADLFTYDALGRLTGAKTLWGDPPAYPVVEVTYTWDSLGRLQEESFQYLGGPSLGGPTDKTVASGYTFAGSDEDFRFRRSVEYPSGFELAQVPDGLARLKSIDLKLPNASSNLLAEYRHVGGRPLVRRLHHGTGGNTFQETLHTWDGQRRLTDLLAEIPGGATLSRSTHVFDLEGNPQKVQYRRQGTSDTQGGDMFLLDGHYRLKETKLGVPGSQFGGTFGDATSWAEHQVYDLDGGNNRERTVHQLSGQAPEETFYTLEPESSRYDTVGGVTFLYDGNGNLIFNGETYYVFDFKNRLSEIYRYIPDGQESGTSGSGMYSGRTLYSPSAHKLHDLRDHAVAKWLGHRGDLATGYRDATGTKALASDPQATGGTLELIALYAYDPFNRRTLRAVAGEPTLHSVYDGWREIEEVAHDSGQTETTVRAYVWGRTLDELLFFARNDSGTWTRRFAHQDRLGSIVRLTDDQGSILEAYEYDPYGRPTVFDASEQPIGDLSAQGNPYLFTARRLDPETGLYYFRNRYYVPAIGRFLAVDPLGVWADPATTGNPYSYVGNRPSSAIDSFGLYTIVIVAHYGGGLSEAAVEYGIDLVRNDPEGGTVFAMSPDGAFTRRHWSGTDPLEPQEINIVVSDHGYISRGPTGSYGQASMGGENIATVIARIQRFLGLWDRKPDSVTALVCYGALTRSLPRNRRRDNLATAMFDEFGVDVQSFEGEPRLVRSGGRLKVVGGKPAIVGPEPGDK